MLALVFAVALSGQSTVAAETMADSLAERAATAEAAMADARLAEQEAAIATSDDLDAICRLARMGQEELHKINDRLSAARVLVSRAAVAEPRSDLSAAADLLSDDDDLALAHMYLAWTKNRSCEGSVAP